jgi:hypothetical protein
MLVKHQNASPLIDIAAAQGVKATANTHVFGQSTSPNSARTRALPSPSPLGNSRNRVSDWCPHWTHCSRGGIVRFCTDTPASGAVTSDDRVTVPRRLAPKSGVRRGVMNESPRFRLNAAEYLLAARTCQREHRSLWSDAKQMRIFRCQPLHDI